MKKFNYHAIDAELYMPDIVNLLSAIHEYKGKQELFIEAQHDILEAMLKVAKIGNGRMSRLLTLLLLYQQGYIVGKYISIELIIEKTKESYYDALEQSSKGWHDGKNNYAPFVKYYLGVILSAYKEFASRVETIRNKGLTKSERIRHIFLNKVGKITKAEIATLCPDISITTIEKALSDLLKEEYIIKIGAGRSTAYIHNHESRE